jgi:hypothetical protein
MYLTRRGWCGKKGFAGVEQRCGVPIGRESFVEPAIADLPTTPMI